MAPAHHRRTCLGFGRCSRCDCVALGLTPPKQPFDEQFAGQDIGACAANVCSVPHSRPSRPEALRGSCVRCSITPPPAPPRPGQATNQYSRPEHRSRMIPWFRVGWRARSPGRSPGCPDRRCGWVNGQHKRLAEYRHVEPITVTTSRNSAAGTRLGKPETGTFPKASATTLDRNLFNGGWGGVECEKKPSGFVRPLEVLLRSPQNWTVFLAVSQGCPRVFSPAAGGRWRSFFDDTYSAPPTTGTARRSRAGPRPGEYDQHSQAGSESCRNRSASASIRASRSPHPCRSCRAS